MLIFAVSIVIAILSALCVISLLGYFVDKKEPFEKLAGTKKWITDAFKKQWVMTRK